jgi:hypothetical protein
LPTSKTHKLEKAIGFHAENKMLWMSTYLLEGEEARDPAEPLGQLLEEFTSKELPKGRIALDVGMPIV